MNKTKIILSFFLLFLFAGVLRAQQGATKNPHLSHTDNGKIRVSDAEWKKLLPANVYHIMREKGTEAPGTGLYVHNTKKGTYYCAACGHPLFSSATKFDSGTGWPSFFEPLNKGSVMEATDNDLGVTRTEIMCARCGGHLGHVFDDGPKPTGLRYCMNGFALSFEAGK